MKQYSGALWAVSEVECIWFGDLTVEAETPEAAVSKIIRDNWDTGLTKKGFEPVVRDLYVRKAM